MSTSKPATFAELKAYALRRLGYPAIDINVCDEQLDDLIYEALQIFQEMHYEGQMHTFIKIQVTQPMKDAAVGASQIADTQWYQNNNFIQLPPNLVGINHVYTNMGASSVVPANIFNIKYQIFLNDIYNFTHGEILHYFMTSQYLETLDWVTNSGANRRVKYTQGVDRLYLDFDWRDLKVGEYILVDCIMGVDPEVFPTAYNNEWLKGYVTALFMQQWGQNLSKYDGIQMLGGVTLNARQILEDAVKMKKEMAEDLRKTYELPPMDLIG